MAQIQQRVVFVELGVRLLCSFLIMLELPLLLAVADCPLNIRTSETGFASQYDYESVC